MGLTHRPPVVIKDGQLNVPVIVNNDSLESIPVTGKITGGDEQFIADVSDVYGHKALSVTQSNSDAFGRSRTSELRNVFEWQFRYDVSFNSYWTISNVNGASQTQDVDRKALALNCAAQLGSKSVVQSRRRIEYVPGLSQLVKLTFNMNGDSSEYIKSLGLYDEDNGLIFRVNAGTPQFIIRSKATGSIVERVVDQSDWNGDKLDGTGSSGATLDLTKHQLLFIDFGYLGIGDVRFFFYVNNKVVLAHTFKSANEIDRMYMQSGILPIRAEIEAIGTPTLPDTMYITCSSVSNEGKQTSIGRIRSGNSGTAPVSVSGTESFGFALRIKDIYSYSSVAAISFSLIPISGNSIAIYRVYHNATLTGATWVDNPNSITQSVSNTPTVAPGLLIQSGYINLASGGKTAELLSESFFSDLFLGFDINNVPDNLCIALQTVSGTGSVYLNVQWREIS